MNLSLEQTQEALNRWARCNIMDLPKKFFGLPMEKTELDFLTPYDGDLFKVKSLYLNGAHLIEVLSQESISINVDTEFKLSFGLRDVMSDNLKVMPILRVFNKPKGCVCNFPFVSAESGYGDDKPTFGVGSHAMGSGAFQVPETYLKSVARTWGNSKISKIEDVFTARVNTPFSKEPELSKLLGYNISSNTNASIHTMLVKYLSKTSPDFELAFIGFHFGIDLNKADTVDTFTYVTVVEFRLKQIKDNNQSAADILTKIHQDLLFDMGIEVNILSTQTNPEKDDIEETVQVLYQYLRPCPPFGNCQE
jgi:hypothetical protein